MKTEGIFHIELDVTELERSVRFYTQLMGMRELYRDGPNLVFLQTPGAHDLLALRKVDRPIEHQAGGLRHFAFQVAKEEHGRAVEEARAYGAPVLRVGKHNPTTLFAYILDPDGYTVEISG